MNLDTSPLLKSKNQKKAPAPLKHEDPIEDIHHIARWSLQRLVDTAGLGTDEANELMNRVTGATTSIINTHKAVVAAKEQAVKSYSKVVTHLSPRAGN